jgi:hypothetical protein
MQKMQNNLFLANPPDENYRYFELGDQEEYSVEWPRVVELQIIGIVRSIYERGGEDGR